MIQDLAVGRLENEYRNVQPTSDATVVCFRGNRALVARAAENDLTLPTYGQVMAWAQAEHWTHWNDDAPVQYVFRLHDRNYFIWMGEGGESSDPDFGYQMVRELRQAMPRELCFALMTAWHLFVWYRDNRFCGRCGARAVHDHKERMMRCPECGNMIFPKIAPAVIIAVTDGDRILMSSYAASKPPRYALIAGFVEIGETGEQTVQREVMEEVGLKVKNIRYYKTQPWGVESDLLLGYYCDLDGDDTIHLDEDELSMAGWYDRHNIPPEAADDGVSMTREMIRVFAEGREPLGNRDT